MPAAELARYPWAVTRLPIVLPAALALLAAGPAAAGPRVVSLDQCADQYVLALSAPADIAGLSYRADDADSFAHGCPSSV